MSSLKSTFHVRNMSLASNPPPVHSMQFFRYILAEQAISHILLKEDPVIYMNIFPASYISRPVSKMSTAFKAHFALADFFRILTQAARIPIKMKAGR